MVHGDEVTKTEIKDSVVSKSNIGSGGDDKLTKIKELKELHDAGAIDDDEFKQMKKEILGK
ncbi:MAG TPA: SHOCT domain-containing protein [Flavobacteriales bacterium]|nr:SHOCT domain-containing protein [Flavobacteriales bacterium]